MPQGGERPYPLQTFDETLTKPFSCQDHPEKCTHKMAEMPRWISSAKMEKVKTLLADDPVRDAMLCATRLFSMSLRTSFFVVLPTYILPFGNTNL